MAKQSGHHVLGISLVILFLTATGQCGQRSNQEDVAGGPIRAPVVA